MQDPAGGGEAAPRNGSGNPPIQKSAGVLSFASRNWRRSYCDRCADKEADSNLPPGFYPDAARSGHVIGKQLRHTSTLYPACKQTGGLNVDGARSDSAPY